MLGVFLCPFYKLFEMYNYCFESYSRILGY